MTISDTQFAAWLATAAVRVLLCELDYAYESGGAPVEATIYTSTRPYSDPASAGSQPYRARLRTMAGIERSIDPDSIGGITKIAVGGITFDNADGALDHLLRRPIDGREARFYIGGEDWARSDFRLVLVALQEVADAPDDQTLNVSLRDQRLLLDREIAGDVVNDERRKPLVFSFQSTDYARSIEPVVKDAVTLEYWVLQNFANGSIGAITDNGIDIGTVTLTNLTNVQLTANAGTDTLTTPFSPHGLSVNQVVSFSGSSIFAGLSNNVQYWVIAAGLTANDFRLSTTRGGGAVDITGTVFAGTVGMQVKNYYDGVTVDGSIQLTAAPAGRLLVDLRGHSASQTINDASGGPGELLRALIVDYGDSNLTIDAASFTSIYSQLDPDIQSTARAVVERENLLSVLEDVARVDQIFFGPAYDGTLYAFRLNLSALQSESAVATLTAGALLEDPQVENERVITGTVAVNSRRNHQPLTFGEFASAVTTADRALLSGQFQKAAENTAPSGTAYATNWQGFFRTARRVEVEGAFAQADADLVAIADELLGDYEPFVKRVHVVTDLRAYTWRLGQVIRFEYPRYGFDAGVNCRVIRSVPDFVEERVSLTLLTRLSPTITVAS